MADCITEGDLESWRGSVLSDYITPIKAHKFDKNFDTPLPKEESVNDGL